jgi:hypothetical protein
MHGLAETGIVSISKRRKVENEWSRLLNRPVAIGEHSLQPGGLDNVGQGIGNLAQSQRRECSRAVHARHKADLLDYDTKRIKKYLIALLLGICRKMRVDTIGIGIVHNSVAVLDRGKRNGGDVHHQGVQEVEGLARGDSECVLARKGCVDVECSSLHGLLIAIVVRPESLEGERVK